MYYLVQKMDLVVTSSSGIGNRLRVMFSFVHLCYKNYNINNLHFIWEKNRECNGFFEDCFESPQLNWIHVNKTYSSFVDIKTNFHISDKIPSWVPFVFPFSDAVKQKAYEIINTIGDDFLGIHLRKTDRKESDKVMQYKAPFLQMNDDDYFLKIPDNTNKPIYLPTDNIETQRKFQKKFGERCYINKNIQDTKELRKSELFDAAVDMFICSEASEFYGSFRSSFSEIVKAFRDAKVYDMVELDSTEYMSDAWDVYYQDANKEIKKKEPKGFQNLKKNKRVYKMLYE